MGALERQERRRNTEVGAESGLFFQEPVFQNATNSADSVLPANFFSLGVSSSMVGNGHLVNSGTTARQFGGNFGLKAKPVFLKRDRLNQLTPEGLVASLHVGEVQVGEHV